MQAKLRCEHEHPFVGLLKGYDRANIYICYWNNSY